jgi:hypothetical protein
MESSVTVREVYQLIDQKIGEVNQNLLRLEGKFDALEAGRLSHLEREFANLQGKMSIVAILVSLFISVLVSIANYILSH